MNALMFEIVSLCSSRHRRIDSRLFGQQARRPGVRHVGQDLDALVAEVGDPADRLLDREVQVRVGTEGKFHGWHPARGVRKPTILTFDGTGRYPAFLRVARIAISRFPCRVRSSVLAVLPVSFNLLRT